MESSIEDHTFGPTDVMEHFPKISLLKAKIGCQKQIVL